ncbi:hypothetical protein [Thalassobacillus sp. C254]|uniref:hypothetical protein n=1 Tax=Thalassobacillus sp. C254 TaxID=1225341 RepID=UPI0006D15703|nr:hypothetical protein [Thalassobacillus sp. C254]
MSTPINLVEETQEAFAAKYGLTIVMMDEFGEPLTPSKGSNELYEELSTHQNVRRMLKESLNEKWLISSPVMLEILPGINVIIAPLQTMTKSYYLAMGMIVEERTRELVADQLTPKSGSNKDKLKWEIILNKAHKLTQENKNEWLDKAKNLSMILMLCLEELEKEEARKKEARLFREAANEEDIKRLFHYFINVSNELDFMGFAEKKDNEAYECTALAGEGTEVFSEVKFYPGEGLLGRVLLTGRADSWENIEEDPRSFFFHSYSFLPKALYCFPVQRRDGQLSLMFGGTRKNKKLSKSVLEQGSTLAALLEKNLFTRDLHNEHEHKSNQLVSIMEICSFMSPGTEGKEILYILVDIGITMFQNSFSYVVYKEEKSDNFQLISRGMSGENVEKYAQKAAEGFSWIEKVESSTPRYRETQEGYSLIEVPILYQENLLGILCVGSSSVDKETLEKESPFLQALSLVSGASIF